MDITRADQDLGGRKRKKGEDEDHSEHDSDSASETPGPMKRPAKKRQESSGQS